MWQSLKEWDQELFVFLNNLGVENYDCFWIFVTQIESWIGLFIYFLVLIFYFYGKKGFTVLFYALLVVILTLSITNLTKSYVGRLRPSENELFSDLIRVLQKPSHFSFFSGHASSSFAITTFVVLMLRKFNKWIYFAFIWPCLFALSRIYVGVHFPSDIITGAAVGSSIALIGHGFCKRYIGRV